MGERDNQHGTLSITTHKWSAAAGDGDVLQYMYFNAFMLGLFYFVCSI